MSDTTQTIDKTNRAGEITLSAGLRKILNKKFAELKSAASESTDELTRYLIEARVHLPNVGGLALPKGVGFHKYLTFEITEEEPGLGITEAEAIAVATEQADEEVPGNSGVDISSVSTLQASW
jgi:hypothetical protein